MYKWLRIGNGGLLRHESQSDGTLPILNSSNRGEKFFQGVQLAKIRGKRTVNKEQKNKKADQEQKQEKALKREEDGNNNGRKKSPH